MKLKGPAEVDQSVRTLNGSIILKEGKAKYFSDDVREGTEDIPDNEIPNLVWGFGFYHVEEDTAQKPPAKAATTSSAPSTSSTSSTGASADS